MKLATLDTGRPDGSLLVVASDLRRCLPAPDGIGTLQAALDAWDDAAPRLRERYARLCDGDGEPLDHRRCLAPLPRAYGWIDGSTFLTHMERLRAVRGASLPPDHRGEPIVYQSASDRFLAPTAPIGLPDERWGLDLEATVAVIAGPLRRGAGPAEAGEAIRLVLLADDFTHRELLPAEMAKGVGLFHAKPRRPFAPIAVTPDALGDTWRGGLLHATVCCEVNGERLGALDAAADCAFPFPELLAYLARSRDLAPGTVVGSGTVSNRDPARGFGCLAERRAVEALDGPPRTRYLRAGDRLRVEALDAAGASLFGAMEHRIVDAGVDHERQEAA